MIIHNYDPIEKVATTYDSEDISKSVTWKMDDFEFELLRETAPIANMSVEKLIEDHCRFEYGKKYEGY